MVDASNPGFGYHSSASPLPSLNDPETFAYALTGVIATIFVVWSEGEEKGTGARGAPVPKVGLGGKTKRAECLR
jgi:hypothetical protein